MQLQKSTTGTKILERLHEKHYRAGIMLGDYEHAFKAREDFISGKINVLVAYFGFYRSLGVHSVAGIFIYASLLLSLSFEIATTPKQTCSR